MIIAKTLEEIELMREAALVVSRTLGMLASEVKPSFYFTKCVIRQYFLYIFFCDINPSWICW